MATSAPARTRAKSDRKSFAAWASDTRIASLLISFNRKTSVQLQSANARTPPKTEESQRPESKTIQPLAVPDETCKTSAPGLRWGFVTTDHVFRDGRLTDVDTQFQQLTVNPRRTPQRVGLRHGPNQVADVDWDGRSSRASSTFPRSPQAKALPMPRDDGFGLDDNERRSPGTPRP